MIGETFCDMDHALDEDFPGTGPALREIPKRTALTCGM